MRRKTTLADLESSTISAVLLNNRPLNVSIWKYAQASVLHRLTDYVTTDAALKLPCGPIFGELGL
jgi:hypothetical protein